MTDKSTILVNFDGVIYSYKSGWTGIDDLPDEPVEGAKRGIEQLRENYNVVVQSTRCSQPRGIKAIEEYLETYDIKVDGVVYKLPPYLLFIDDKSITFEGAWDEDLLKKVREFKPWYR